MLTHFYSFISRKNTLKKSIYQKKNCKWHFKMIQHGIPFQIPV